jgi:hypothetical protein
VRNLPTRLHQWVMDFGSPLRYGRNDRSRCHQAFFSILLDMVRGAVKKRRSRSNIRDADGGPRQQVKPRRAMLHLLSADEYLRSTVPAFPEWTLCGYRQGAVRHRNYEMLISVWLGLGEVARRRIMPSPVRIRPVLRRVREAGSGTAVATKPWTFPAESK